MGALFTVQLQQRLPYLLLALTFGAAADVAGRLPAGGPTVHGGAAHHAGGAAPFENGHRAVQGGLQPPVHAQRLRWRARTAPHEALVPTPYH